MAAQVPGPSSDWQPISNSSQFLDVSSSTALTVPAVPTSAGRSPVGAKLVAIIYAQGVAAWVRTDGQAVTAAYSGGIKLAADTFMIVYGTSALNGIRLIRDAANGGVAISYYWFRPSEST